jgi:hypothetical protein
MLTERHEEDEAIESQDRVVTADISHSGSPGLISLHRHRLCSPRYFIVYFKSLKHRPG